MKRENTEKVALKSKCTKCNKSFAGQEKGSITAWLFRPAECHCESIELVVTPDPAQSHAPSNFAGAPISRDEAANNLPANNLATNNLATNNLPTNNLPTNNLPTNNLPTSNLTTNNLATNNVKVEMIGRFRIVKEIGNGGMGTVYQVVESATNAEFALKLLAPHLAAQKLLCKRMEQEAELACQLNHPNIAAVYEVDRTDLDVPYIIMDYISGQSLEQRLESQLIFNENDALNIFIQTADALSYAHKHSVVHRDLKPSNIILSRADSGTEIVKLVDFGIAKVMEPEGVNATNLTQTGELLGSPQYMSPEQCRGDFTDARSDIYSFGCMMYQCLCGRPPFEGNNPVRIILKHISDDPRPLSKAVIASPALKNLIMRCLEKDPNDRYQSAELLLKDLELIRDGKKPLTAKLRKPTNYKKLGVGFFLILSIPLTLFGAAHISQFWSAPPVTPLQSLVPPPVSVQPALIGEGWDFLDLRGQRDFNQGLYAKAKADFTSAYKLDDASDEQKLLTLQKLELLNHVTGDLNGEKNAQKLAQQLETTILHRNHLYTDAEASEAIKSLQKLVRLKDPASKKTQEKLRESALRAIKQLHDRRMYSEERALINVYAPLFALQSKPNAPDVTVLGLQADLDLETDNTEAAIKTSEEIIQRLKNAPVADLSLNESLLRLARAYNSKKLGGQAAGYAKLALDNLKHGAKSSAVTKQICEAELQYAEALFLQNLTKDAVTHYRKAINLATESDDTKNLAKSIEGLANLYSWQGNFPEAEKVLVEAMSNAETKPALVKAEIETALGDLYFRQLQMTNMNSKAGPYFRDALRIKQHVLSPYTASVKDAVAKVVAFDAYAVNLANEPSDITEGGALSKQTLAAQPVSANNVRQRADLAYFLFKGGKTEESKREIDKVLADPGAVANAKSLSDAFYQAVEAVEGAAGLQALQKVFELRVQRLQAKPGDDLPLALALDDLGHSYYKQRMMAQANDAIEKAAKIVMSHPPNSLDGEYRWLAAGVLDNYSMILHHRGDDAWHKYVALAASYRTAEPESE